MKKSLACLLSVAPVIALAQTGGFVGDIGAMALTSGAIVKGAERSTTAMPYVYGDWGPFYARVDTLGIKTLPVGDGHLELAMRISTEDIKAGKTAYPAAGDRSAPLPVGVGTFQRTALGGLFAYAMHDTRSGGQFGELNWAGKLDVGPVKLYPQLGVQYRSADLLRNLYGIDATQATISSDDSLCSATEWNLRAQVTDTRTGQSRTLTTGSDGQFRVDSLVTGGPYTVTATADGFEGRAARAVDAGEPQHDRVAPLAPQEPLGFQHKVHVDRENISKTFTSWTGSIRGVK